MKMYQSIPLSARVRKHAQRASRAVQRGEWVRADVELKIALRLRVEDIERVEAGEEVSPSQLERLLEL